MLRTSLAAALLAGTAFLAQTAYAATPGYMVETTAMRAGPDNDYPTVRLVHDGREVFIHGCLDDWSWCDVSYHLDRGWVLGQDLDADYDGRRAGIVSIAPALGLAVLAFSFDDYWGRYYRSRPFYSQRDHWQSFSSEHHRDNWGPRPDHGGGRPAGQPEGSRAGFHADADHNRPAAGQHPQVHQDHHQAPENHAAENHANVPSAQREQHQMQPRPAHQENRPAAAEHPQAAAMHAPPMHQEQHPAAQPQQHARPQPQHAQPQQHGAPGEDKKKDEH